MHTLKMAAILDFEAAAADSSSLRLDARDTDPPGLRAAMAPIQPRMAAILDFEAKH